MMALTTFLCFLLYIASSQGLLSAPPQRLGRLGPTGNTRHILPAETSFACKNSFSQESVLSLLRLHQATKDTDASSPLPSNQTTTNNDSTASSTSTVQLALLNRALCLVYFAVGRFLLQGQTLILATLWLGFVLAISGTEAWLKFQAPFCPKPFALDIGRTVFPALNSVELGLCGALWFCHGSKANVMRRSLPGKIATGILFLDILFLTPELMQRGKQVVYRHVQKKQVKAKRGKQSPEFKALAKEFKGQPLRKKNSWHLVYVGLEGVKIAALSLLIRAATVAAS